MSICVRLDKETEELLDKASRLLQTTKSDVVKRTIKQYCEPVLEKKSRNLYEFIKERIDKWPGSGRGDLSVRHREVMLEMLQEKRRQRRL